MEQAIIDLVILVYKPDHRLAKLLRALRKQTQPIHRIILINTEKVFFRERDFAGIVPYEVHHITKQEFDHAATRNYGMQLAKEADYVVMMTQDAVPANEYLVEELLKGMHLQGKNGEPIAVSYARQLPQRRASEKERFMRNFSYPKTSLVKIAEDEAELGIRTYFCSDVCAMYNRKIYDACGGFVKKAIFNEDMLFAYKALQSGYATYYAAEAKVVHSHDYNMQQQFTRHFDMGVSQAMHPEVFKRVSSESEGLSLVLRTTSYLVRIGHWYKVPYMIMNQASRYVGYLCGKNYRLWGKRLCRKMSANPEFWK